MQGRPLGLGLPARSRLALRGGEDRTMDFAGQQAFVRGACTGIGQDVARQIVIGGRRIVLADRPSEPCPSRDKCECIQE